MLAVPTFLLKILHNYDPEDLENMYRAFIQACGEHPDKSANKATRECLARAMVSVYQPHFTQTQLIAAALAQVSDSHA